MRAPRARLHAGSPILLLIIALPACDFVDSGGSQGVTVEGGWSRTVNEQTQVVLDAAAVTDVDDDASYQWSQISGLTVDLKNAKTRTARFVAPRVDRRMVLVFRLIKTDEFGGSDTGELQITINDSPVADAGTNRSGVPGTRVALNGRDSTDTDGTITFAWLQMGGPPAASAEGFNTPVPSFIMPAAQSGAVLTFRLVVRDNDGARATDTVNATVDAAPLLPLPPILSLLLSPDPPPPPDAGDDTDHGNDDGDIGDDDGGFVLFNAMASTTADGKAVASHLASTAKSDGCWTTPPGHAVSGSLPGGENMGRQLIYRLTKDARQGTVAILDATAGRFRYTPHGPTVGGIDWFMYEVSDGYANEQRMAKIVIGPRIMALGDGATAGLVNRATQLPRAPLRVGYRQHLQELLAAGGYTADFVGSQSFGYRVEDFDPDNEAHVGWTTTEMAYGKRADGRGGIYSWLSAHPADIVLLLISAKQILDGTFGVEAILGEIDRWEASSGVNPVTVVLAGAPGEMPDLTIFNNEIKAMVARRAISPFNEPDDIIVTDHNQVLTYPTDFHSRLYPNEVGYRKIAETWHTTLIDHGLLNKCP